MEGTLIRMENRVGMLVGLSVGGALVAAVARVALGLATEGSSSPLVSGDTWNYAVSRWNLSQAALIGATVSLALGATALWWHENRNSRFQTATDVTQSLSLPVLGVVPAIETRAERSARRGRILWRTATLAVVAVSIGWIVWWLI